MTDHKSLEQRAVWVSDGSSYATTTYQHWNVRITYLYKRKLWLLDMTRANEVGTGSLRFTAIPRDWGLLSIQRWAIAYIDLEQIASCEATEKARDPTWPGEIKLLRQQVSDLEETIKTLTERNRQLERATPLRPRPQMIGAHTDLENAKKLREKRERKAITISEASKLTGIDPLHFSQLEIGSMTLSDEDWERVFEKINQQEPTWIENPEKDTRK